MRKLLVLLIFCAAPLFAQQPDPVAIVANVLQLSPDQITSWSGILHARELAIAPLAQQAQSEQQAVAQALGTASPDPLQVGQAIVTLHATQMQIAEANGQSAEAFEKLLTSDQLQRLNALRGEAQVCPILPAFQATGLLGN